MNTITSLEKLIGNWTGTSQLWRPWLSPPDSTSPSLATVSLTVGSKFVSLTYTWAVDGEAQEGLLLLRADPAANSVHTVWVDSWHMSDNFMFCRGQVSDSGAISMLGSYAAPPGPDWGWRTVIEPGDDAFRLVMYNIPPEGAEDLAFENLYTRLR